jgi:hypothetical protein
MGRWFILAGLLLVGIGIILHMHPGCSAGFPGISDTKGKTAAFYPHHLFDSH